MSTKVEIQEEKTKIKLTNSQQNKEEIELNEDQIETLKNQFFNFRLTSKKLLISMNSGFFGGIVGSFVTALCLNKFGNKNSINTEKGRDFTRLGGIFGSICGGLSSFYNNDTYNCGVYGFYYGLTGGVLTLFLFN
jgi:hypothetical protein